MKEWPPLLITKKLSPVHVMTEVLIVFILTAFTLPAVGQSTNNEFPVTVKGTINNTKDSTPVSNVHLIRFSDASGAVTDQEGEFTLRLRRKTDSFIIAAVGYGRTIYDPVDTFDGDTLNVNIFIEPYTYRLPEVEFVEEAARTLDMDFELSEKQRREIAAGNKMDNTGGGIGVTMDGAVTSLYEALSNNKQQEKALRRLELKEKNIEFLVEGPYRAYIESEFGLMGKDLTRFLYFCNYKKDLTKMNYYEVVERLKFWHTRYKSWLISRDKDIDYRNK